MEINEDRIKKIEDRLTATERYHKNLTPDGDLKTVFNFVPVLVLTTTLGLFLGYNLYRVMSKK